MPAGGQLTLALSPQRHGNPARSPARIAAYNLIKAVN